MVETRNFDTMYIKLGFNGGMYNFCYVNCSRHFILQCQALTVTPEDVQQKVAAMAKEIGLARWEYTFTMSQSWFSALQQAESTKTNLTKQIINYTDNIIGDISINVTSLGKFQSSSLGKLLVLCFSR